MATLTHHMGVGAMTPTGFRYRSRASAAATLSIEYSTASNLAGSTTSSGVAVVADDDFTGGETITGLTPATQYFYSIKVDGVRAHSAPYPTFRTFPPEGIATPIKVAWGSCQLTPNGPVFEAIGNEDPDVFLHVGDLVYADTPDIPTLRSTFYQAQFGIGASDMLTHVINKMPWDFAWDDHDFGQPGGNGNGREHTLKANNLKVYKEYGMFYPLVQPTLGIWHSFKLANAEFFVIDTRYQREGSLVRFPSTATEVNPDTGSSGTTLVIPAANSPSAFNNWYRTYYCKFADGTVRRVLSYTGATRTLTLDGNMGDGPFHLRRASMLDMDMIANSQLDWLIQSINNSTAKWKFFVTSSVWNPSGTEQDNWGGFDKTASSNDQMEIAYLKQHITASNVIVLSGDRHWSAIDDGRNSYWPECTSSPLDHSDNRNDGLWSQGRYYNGDAYAIAEITEHSVTLTVKKFDGTLPTGIHAVAPLTITDGTVPSGTAPDDGYIWIGAPAA